MKKSININVTFEIHKGDSNQHGTQKPGEAWNGETVKGLKLKRIDMKANKRDGFYLRWIFYFPSGACRYFDVYKPVTK